jgi:RNA polymerase sigma-70 factor (ECF subfamily)
MSAFAALVDGYRDAVLAVAYHYLRNLEDAQDAAQEVFVKAYVHLQQLRDPARFGPWLRRITATYCLGRLRQRTAAPIPLEEVPEVVAASSSGEAEHLAARIVVRDALARLPEKARLTATLFYIDGYSHGEISDFLEVPVRTVRSRLQRARSQLREEMITLVSDVLNEGKPGTEFTPEVIEEIMRRGDEARRANVPAESICQFDEALTAVKGLAETENRKRLEMRALWGKAFAVPFLRGWDEHIQLLQQALAIAKEIGDGPWQAAILRAIAQAHANMQRPEFEEKYHRQALRILKDLGDAQGTAAGNRFITHQLLSSSCVHPLPVSGNSPPSLRRRVCLLHPKP